MRSLLFPLSSVVRRPRSAVLVATTNPFWLPLAVAARRTVPLVILVYDLYPDALAIRWHLNARVRRILEWFIGLAFRRADAVVVLGERARSMLLSRYRLRCPIHVIPTGADPSTFSGRRTKPPGVTVVASYVGNTGSMHDAETLGRGLAVGLARHPNLEVLVATRGDRAEDLLKPLRSTPRTTILPELQDTQFADAMAFTDISLVTLAPNAGSISLPSKVYSALAAGCAILAVAPRASDLADLIESTGAGIVVEPGDVDGVAEALSVLMTPARFDFARAALRAAESFTPEVLAKAWAELLLTFVEPRVGRLR